MKRASIRQTHLHRKWLPPQPSRTPVCARYYFHKWKTHFVHSYML